MSVAEFDSLVGLVEEYEHIHGKIDLSNHLTMDCQCTGSHCSTGCEGNKGLGDGDMWPKPKMS